jgi:hypothetical protein
VMTVTAATATGLAATGALVARAVTGATVPTAATVVTALIAATVATVRLRPATAVADPLVFGKDSHHGDQTLLPPPQGLPVLGR